MATKTTTLMVKTADLYVKEAGADDGLAEGEFVAYASVFGNVDSYGDIVEDTFFDRTLAEWAEKGDTIPVLWGHDLYDPFSNIGGVKTATVIKAEAAKADGDKPGLKIHGFLDLENPTAAQVYRLMKGRRTTKMSFAYAVTDAEQRDDGYHLKDGDLYEVSIVQVPANQEAEILAVKQALEPLLVKAGRVLSAKNEASLREARDAIDAVLAALDAQDSGDSEQDQEKASSAAKVKTSGQPEAQQRKGPSETEDTKAKGLSVDDWDTIFQTYGATVAPSEGA